MVADVVLINGSVITMNESQPSAEAIAVQNGVILEVASNKKIRQRVGTKTKVVDLRGRTVVPGLIDTHVHMAEFGSFLSWINLRGVGSISEMQRLLQKKVTATPKGKWVFGRGWDQDNLRERRYPTRWDLDRFSPHNAVVFTRVCGHIGVVNSGALELMGISKGTRSPVGGVIDVDPRTGEPTGVLRETAVNSVWMSVPERSEEELTAVCSLACRKAAEVGLTSVHWFVGSVREIRVLQRLHVRGKLPIRVYLVVPIEFLDCLVGVGFSTGLGDSFLRLGGVKVLVDGSLGARTAALERWYDDDRSTRGLLIWSERRLRKEVLKAQGSGIQVCVHAIGDRAVRVVLEAFERVLEFGRGGNVFRHRVEHASVLSARLVDRLSRLGLIVCVQPSFVGSDFWVVDRVGRGRARWTYAFKTLIRRGVLLAGGSDCPVESISPLVGVYWAVTRGGLCPGECLSVWEGLRLYTVDAAFASFEENVKGSIEPGKFADFTVLSDDPFRVKPEELRDVKVEMTIVGGKIVYKR